MEREPLTHHTRPVFRIQLQLRLYKPTTVLKASTACSGQDNVVVSNLSHRLKQLIVKYRVSQTESLD